MLTASDLLLHCSVWGSGLDALPLPGNTWREALAAMPPDAGALALRLNKPLTVRPMPILGKQAGDEIALHYSYCAPSRVLAPHTTGLSGLLAAADNLLLEPHHK